MSKRSVISRLVRPRLMVTPVLFLHLAILGIVVFGVCHLLGFRQHVSIITTGRLPGAGPALKACAYLGSYLLLVLLVPILLLASAIFAALQRAATRPEAKDK